jgi:hypothetical protein
MSKLAHKKLEKVINGSKVKVSNKNLLLHWCCRLYYSVIVIRRMALAISAA